MSSQNLMDHRYSVFQSCRNKIPSLVFFSFSQLAGCCGHLTRLSSHCLTKPTQVAAFLIRWSRWNAAATSQSCSWMYPRSSLFSLFDVLPSVLVYSDHRTWPNNDSRAATVTVTTPFPPSLDLDMRLYHLSWPRRFSDFGLAATCPFRTW